ncbi:Dual-specificity RNA methyltransferase RlmN [Balamuthia mandrillaris]
MGVLQPVSACGKATLTCSVRALARSATARRACCLLRPQQPQRHCSTTASPSVTAERSETGAAVAAPPLMNLFDMSWEEVEALMVQDWKQPAFRAKQLWHDIYVKGMIDFEQMSTLPVSLRQQLSQRCTLGYAHVKKELCSKLDSTRKWLLSFEDKERSKKANVETVFIPEDTRGTLCVSSQVGCTLACTFCHTGTQPIMRNLKAGEIVTQLMTARRQLSAFPLSAMERNVISNIVFMGQGEPFYNYRNVQKALKILTHPEGCQINKRRITVSTSGVVPNISRLGSDFPGIGLAISLHAPNDQLRNQIVPLNKQYPLAQLLNACKAFPGLSYMNRITFEYVMLNQVNDEISHAEELVKLIKGIPCKVNLIPFNPWPGAPYKCSSPERIARFTQVLLRAGLDCPVRKSRGRDIMAACGQLNTTDKTTPATTTPTTSPAAVV